jgi:hypothetical protein
METVLSIHSFVDVITNSSTEMYIDYSGSIEPCKKMINEMFKACGSDKTCDDVFDIKLRNTNYEDRLRYDENFDPEAPWEEDECSPAEVFIKVKDPQYEQLAKLVISFLESGESKEFMN